MSGCSRTAHTASRLNVRLAHPSFSSTSSTAFQKKPSFDPVIFSGIQPTGIPHLGNYLGLFLPFLHLQRISPQTVPIYLSIVGLHAITLPQSPQQLADDRRNMLAALLACGVDVKRTCLFFQEDIPEHAELAWYLNTITPVGRLQRMTTWKSRLGTSRNGSENEISDVDLRLGLLAYPVLQAADILLYKSTVVPVGDDQKQHIELSRDIAESFNRTFKEIFPLHKARIVPSKRILSLRDATQKMSKSAPNASSRISITDQPDLILSRIKAAVTDSLPTITYDPKTRPGVSNLLLIWSALDASNRGPEVLAEEAQRDGWGMGKLKDVVGEVVAERLKPIKEEYERIRGDEGYLRDVAEQGRSRAGEVAAKTMDEVRKAVGLSRI